MTVFLKDVLPVDLLNKHIEDGVVRKQVHPQYPNLFILNYSELAQFGRIWDDVTNVCRGLIYASTSAGDVVVARPFRKFHNLNTTGVPETLEENLPKGEVPLVTTKMDGSMGILYFWDSKWHVATRGSFASEQAQWATAWIRKNYQFLGSDTLLTAVFEIIYRDNRIVVDYDWEGLILLGMIWKDSGKEYSRLACEDWAFTKGFKIVPKFDKSLSECVAENTLNEEGYVLTYSNGVKVKVKFVEYCRLHRILTGLQPRAIWEMLVAKQDVAIDTLLNDPKIPAGFKDWFGGWVVQLRKNFADMERRTQEVFATRPDDSLKLVDPKAWRKAQAIHFQRNAPDLCSALFPMLDGNDYATPLWNKLYPAATGTFQKDGDN